MANRKTNVANFWETTLTATFGATDLTATVASTSGLTSPSLVVIDPDVPASREVIYFDGTFTGTTLVTSALGNRYLSGSAAGSGLSHSSGAVVRSVPLRQHIDDLNDRISSHAHGGGDDGATVSHDALSGVSANDHHNEDHASRHALGGADPLLALVPAGAIVAYGGGSAPSGWLLCQGQAVSRVTYAALFSAIGTTYGVGDGSTTFNLPDLQQRFPMGKAPSGTGATLGATGGTVDRTHTHGQPTHTHTGPSHTHSTDIASFNTGTDGDHSHNPSSAPVAGGALKFQTTVSTDALSTTTNGDHTHTVNPPSTTSSASGTGATGASGGDTTDADAAYNPPYQVVNFIVKT